MAAMGGISPLAKQVQSAECSHIASQTAANALIQIAGVDADYKTEVTHALITARHWAIDATKEKIAANALTTLSADTDDPESNAAVGFAILLFKLHTRD